MNIRRKIIVLATLIAIALVYAFVEYNFTNALIRNYNRVYYSLQSVRIGITSIVPFSLGDIAYVAAGIGVVVAVVRWVYLLLHFKSSKEKFWVITVKSVSAAVATYLLFIAGWGANYNKIPLYKHWGLSEQIDTSILLSGNMAINFDTSCQRLPKRLLPLVDFNIYLLSKINEYAPGYKDLPLNAINTRAVSYYASYTNSPISKTGLRIKRSLFGYFLERMAIEGYYNPFTGEGQVNSGLPAFIMPFLVCHEMAHQAGIAAEEDANLMAYAIGVATTDSAFRYSAYLNIWQYANNRLYRFDSVLASRLERRLNPLTLSHLDSLDKINARYHKQMARYSSEIYDSYLKMNDQKDGVRSYANVSKSARILEKSNLFYRRNKLIVP